MGDCARLAEGWRHDMTRYCHVNSFPNGSTGAIMMKEHRELLASGEESHAFWGRGRGAEDETERRFATDAEVCLDGLMTRLDDRAGFHSKTATRRLLAQLDEIQPDVVHLHNLHGYYMNVEMLFGWLAAHRNVHVEWTLHDCWAFTGHCSYFTAANCEQWRAHCSHSERCPQLREYPKTIGLGACKRNFEDKRRAFTSISPERMKLISPSQWLADLVAQSFLNDYLVEVRHNTIDTTVFRPTLSDFRERFGIGDRFMVLGVASTWTARKGLGDFIRLVTELDDNYVIVLVGLSKSQIKKMSKQIVALPRADSQQELAAVYSATDFYMQSSSTDTIDMTAADAIACGTPVAAWEGSACVGAATGGDAQLIAVDCGNLKASVINALGGCRVVMLERTDSREQLAAVYTAANVLFNPTREDNYPTVNLEAQACGTPVVTYDTGGCKETIQPGCGVVVNGLEEALNAIRETREQEDLSRRHYH